MFFWLVGKLKREIPAFLILIAGQVCVAILTVQTALGARRIIDCATGGAGQQALVRAIVIQAALIVGILFSLYLQRTVSQRLNIHLERKWKRELLHHLLGGEYAEVSSFHSAELLNRMNNDVNTVDEALLSVIPGVTGMITKLVASIYVLAVLEPRFTMVLLAVGAVLVAGTAIARKRLKDLHKRLSESNGAVMSFLQEAMEKLLMVQSMGLGGQMEKRAETVFDKRVCLQNKRRRVRDAANLCISILMYGAGFFATVWCSVRLFQGTMSFGSLTAVTQLATQIQSPLINITGFLPQIFTLSGSAERLKELYDLPLRSQEGKTDAAQAYEKMQAICGENICYSYGEENRRVLDNMSFSIEKGVFAVLTGESGIGKSTLLKLLLGVNRPSSGELFLQTADGRLPLTELADRFFSFVPQGNLLLSGTVRDNLLLTNPDATDEQLRQAVYISTMDAFVPQLPQGLDTVLGENGYGLSEGQAQRLAIARAILRDAPVLLLDEATSALDAETEQKVLTRLRALKGKTCIVVTHRPAAIALCDKQICFEAATESQNVIA